MWLPCSLTVQLEKSLEDRSWRKVHQGFFYQIWRNTENWFLTLSYGKIGEGQLESHIDIRTFLEKATLLHTEKTKPTEASWVHSCLVPFVALSRSLDKRNFTNLRSNSKLTFSLNLLLSIEDCRCVLLSLMLLLLSTFSFAAVCSSALWLTVLCSQSLFHYSAIASLWLDSIYSVFGSAFCTSHLLFDAFPWIVLYKRRRSAQPPLVG